MQCDQRIWIRGSVRFWIGLCKVIYVFRMLCEKVFLKNQIKECFFGCFQFVSYIAVEFFTSPFRIFLFHSILYVFCKLNTDLIVHFSIHLILRTDELRIVFLFRLLFSIINLPLLQELSRLFYSQQIGEIRFKSISV